MKLQNGLLWYSILIASISVGFDHPAMPDSNERYHLFKIGRSRDANEIMYDINLDKTGKPDNVNPITIYWVKKTDKNRVKPLTWIQNNFAYGLKLLGQETSHPDNGFDCAIDFQFVSYDKRNFALKKDRNDQYKVFTLSKGKEIEVNRIFVQIDGGSFWVPSISSVELHGMDVQTGKKVIETIHP